jgi:hypothetical protein
MTAGDRANPDHDEPEVLVEPALIFVQLCGRLVLLGRSSAPRTPSC